MPIGSLHGTDLAVELARIESESRGVPRLTVKSDSKMRIAASGTIQSNHGKWGEVAARSFRRRSWRVLLYLTNLPLPSIFGEICGTGAATYTGPSAR